MINLDYIPADNMFVFTVIMMIIVLSTLFTGVCYILARYYEQKKRILDEREYQKELARKAREQRRIEELEFTEQLNEVAADCDYRKAEWIAHQYVERFNDER